MALTRFVILRHGETVWNFERRYQGQLDSPLTELGVTQARALADRLPTGSVAAFYASDLGRARQTAEIISERNGCEVIAHVGLRERHLGIFQGSTREEVKARWPEEYRRLKSGDADYAVPGGESTRALMERVLATLNEIAARHHGNTIAAITHGGPLSALLRHALSIPFEAPRRFSRLNASWNVFALQDGKWLLETWGDTSHWPQGAGRSDV
jgi:2,3-bisphosphoglycerate-dependent phosphoglycerate mutase